MHNIIKVNIRLSQPLNVRSGQYINLLIPSVSFWLFLPSHLFIVVSWAEGKAESLNLLIMPYNNFTKELLRYVSINDALLCLILFSRPYSSVIYIKDYKSIVIIVSESNMVAQLLYLKQLIYYYNNYKAYTCRIHLI